MVEPPSAFTLQPGYHHPVHAYLRPERVVVLTQYFVAQWMPRLGTDRTGLVIVLRQHALQAPEAADSLARGTGAVSLASADIGVQLGLTEKQVQALLVSEPLPEQSPWRRLKVPQRRTYKQYVADQVLALRHFIPRLRYAYEVDPESNKPIRVGYILEIALDDPLTPADLAHVKAKFGVDAPGVNVKIGLYEGLCEPQNLLLQSVNANIGALTSGNLAVTGANAPGSAAAAPSPPAGPPTPSASPRQAVDGPSKGVGHRLPPATDAAMDEQAPSCRAPEDPPPSSSLRTVDMDLPLPQLKERAVGDLRRQRKRSSRVSIVTQFIARLTGLGRDGAGGLRTQPERADYARVGELCKAFGAETVLCQAFALAGRMPEEVMDPLAYLRDSLTHQQRRAAQRQAPRNTRAQIDEYSAEDYRAEGIS